MSTLASIFTNYQRIISYAKFNLDNDLSSITVLSSPVVMERFGPNILFFFYLFFFFFSFRTMKKAHDNEVT